MKLFSSPAFSVAGLHFGQNCILISRRNCKYVQKMHRNQCMNTAWCCMLHTPATADIKYCCNLNCSQVLGDTLDGAFYSLSIGTLTLRVSAFHAHDRKQHFEHFFRTRVTERKNRPVSWQYCHREDSQDLREDEIFSMDK